jgi:hypothetical protein
MYDNRVLLCILHASLLLYLASFVLADCPTHLPATLVSATIKPFSERRKKERRQTRLQVLYVDERGWGCNEGLEDDVGNSALGSATVAPCPIETSSERQSVIVPLD